MSCLILLFKTNPPAKYCGKKKEKFQFILSELLEQCKLIYFTESVWNLLRENLILMQGCIVQYMILLILHYTLIWYLSSSLSISMEFILNTHNSKGVTGNLWLLNWECSIVENFFRTNLRHMKSFNDVKLLSLSAKWTFKIIRLGGYVLRIDKKCFKKSTVN